MAIVIFLSFVEFLERDERVHSMYDRLCVGVLKSRGNNEDRSRRLINFHLRTLVGVSNRKLRQLVEAAYSLTVSAQDENATLFPL